MARVPPSHYNKLFGGKVHGKGPASTKTLTTNTHTATTGVSSVLHDPSVPRTYLFDIYKNEAESHFEIGEYRQAADCYNAAVKLQPNDTAAIIARSRCYVQMGRWKRAMKDCDAALTIDAAFGEALYQKAEILHINGNLDLALVYFKRALKQQPDSMRYKNGVQKVTDAIHKQSGANAQKASKLTAVGDLSMFLHPKTRQKRGGQLKDTPRLDDEDNKVELPSAGFRARFNVAPLIRINRKPGVSILRSYRPESAKSNSSASSANRDPDEATMRTILGELYGDRKYLKKFQNNLPGGKAERDLTLLADEGLEFLRERTIFWDSLGPLPPPQVPKRSNMRERSFFMTNNDISPGRKDKSARPSLHNEGTEVRLPPLHENQYNTSNEKDSSDNNNNNNNNNKGSSNNNTKRENTDLSMALQQASLEAAGKRRTALLPRKPRKKKKLEVAMGLERDYSDVDFKFRSLQISRSGSRMEDTCPDSLPILRETGRSKTRVGRTMFVGMDDPDRDRKRQLTKFINNEMDNIDEAFKTGEFEDCRKKADICLRTVASLPGDDINKNEVIASLHSCIGNACIAMNDFDGALRHHVEALAIGENENLIEVVNRSLGHLGRMYIIQKRFNKALEVFARKAPAVSSAEEIAQVFHEIGNCFLALGHLDYARDCGKKALRAAMEADIHYFKFQSWVLIAVSESRMKHHDEAYKAFDEALRLAKNKDDEESVNVILFAMEHLSKTITSIMKKRAMLSERLTSRSKTQTILDLNKRPHAARLKKRKKRMRREETDVDDLALTRQTTSVLVHEPEEESPDARDEDVNAQDGVELSPRLDFSRGATMFEKNPRELEPFGDPNVMNKKKQEKRVSVRVHSRHGALDRLGSGSRRGSWAGLEEPSSRRESVEDTRLEIPPSPHQMESPVGETLSASKKGSPRNRGHHKQGRKDSGASPTHRVEGLGVLSNANTPRVDFNQDELTARGGCRHMNSFESACQEDGFLSQREEYYSKSRTGGQHSHRGGFHSNRESRAEFNDGEQKYHGGKVTPRDGRDSTQRMVGAKSRSMSRNRRHGKLDASVEEPGGRREEEDGDDTGDVTGVTASTVINSNGYGDLSSGRFGDLSVTMESSFRTPAVEDDDLTPRAHDDFTAEGGDSKGTSPRRHERRNPNAIKKRSLDNNLHNKTLGRFTRESFFDEDELNEDAMNATGGGGSPEHVSVSRQLHVNRNNQKAQRSQKPEAVERKSPEEPTDRNLPASSGNNGNNIQIARSSSKVSLRGKKLEETVVTLETSKPYRVSSATSERNARSGQASRQEDAAAINDVHPYKESKISPRLSVHADGTDHESKPRPDLRSPAKSQASAVTTGSGWEGDVSTETEIGYSNDRKGKPKKPKRLTDEELRVNEGNAQTAEGKRTNEEAQDEEKVDNTHQNQALDKSISKRVHATSSNDDVTLSLPEGTTEGSTVTSLRPQEVQEEVIMKTVDASTEEKILLMSSKLAHLDQRHATKIWRETRDLEDIQSVPYSSRADLETVVKGNPSSNNNNDDKSFIPLESDPARSVTLPVSNVSSQETVAEGLRSNERTGDEEKETCDEV